jgi:hypothetical protein
LRCQRGYGGPVRRAIGISAVIGDFLQALRDFVDSELTMLDRVDLPGMKGPGSELLRRVMYRRDEQPAASFTEVHRHG